MFLAFSSRLPDVAGSDRLRLLEDKLASTVSYYEAEITNLTSELSRLQDDYDEQNKAFQSKWIKILTGKSNCIISDLPVIR